MKKLILFLVIGYGMVYNANILAAEKSGESKDGNGEKRSTQVNKKRRIDNLLSTNPVTHEEITLSRDKSLKYLTNGLRLFDPKVVEFILENKEYYKNEVTFEIIKKLFSLSRLAHSLLRAFLDETNINQEVDYTPTVGATYKMTPLVLLLHSEEVCRNNGADSKALEEISEIAIILFKHGALTGSLNVADKDEVVLVDVRDVIFDTDGKYPQFETVRTAYIKLKIIPAMHEVPALAVFPPGLLPIIGAYLFKE